MQGSIRARLQLSGGIEESGKASPFSSGRGKWPCSVGASDVDLEAVVALGTASAMIKPDNDGLTIAIRRQISRVARM